MSDDGAAGSEIGRKWDLGGTMMVDHDDGKDVTITDFYDVVINVESFVIQDMKCPFPPFQAFRDPFQFGIIQFFCNCIISLSIVLQHRVGLRFKSFVIKEAARRASIIPGCTFVR